MSKRHIPGSKDGLRTLSSPILTLPSSFIITCVGLVEALIICRPIETANPFIARDVSSQIFF